MGTGETGFGPHVSRAPTIVGHPDQPFFSDPRVALANTSRRYPRTTLGDPSSRASRPLPSFARLVVSVEPRVVRVGSVGSGWIPVEIGGK